MTKTVRPRMSAWNWHRVSDTQCRFGALTALTKKFTIQHCQMSIMHHRSEHNRYSAAYAMGREFGENCWRGKCGCVSFGPDPLKSSQSVLV